MLVDRTIRRADERIEDICALTSRHLMTWRIAFASVSTPGEDMLKPRKTVVVAVLLGTVGFLGAGTAYAHGDGHKHGHGHGREHQGREGQTLRINQGTSCTTAEENVDVQGEIGFENGRKGNVHSKGSPGTQNTNVGSTLGCDNTIVFGR
jgi:hypothetical protein